MCKKSLFSISLLTLIFHFFMCVLFCNGVSLYHPGWSAVVQSQITATSASQNSSNSPASASQVARIIGTCHHTQLIFLFLVDMGFHHVGQAGLKLLASDDSPASASQSAWITGMSHCARPLSTFQADLFSTLLMFALGLLHG